MKNVMNNLMPEENLFKNKEIKKDLWTNPPTKWLSIADILSEKIIFKIDKGICQLIDCVTCEYEGFVRDKDKKEFLIKIPPTPDYNDIFVHDKILETQKFLVHLLRKKIISNLHLPSLIRFEKTKGVVLIELRSKSYTEDKFALSDALLKPREFNKEIISFKISNWDAFSKIKKKIEKYKEYKEYKRNEELEEKSRKFTIIKTEKDLQQRSKKEIFEITVKDRKIWINDYLLSKPHAVGSNLEFFEYIRRQSPNTKIERENLPSQFGDLSIKEQIKNKSFIKILNELGFKDEILKAFFPKRGKNIVVYRGNKITKKDLEKSGVKMPLFLKELELAHMKNSPE